MRDQHATFEAAGASVAVVVRERPERLRGHWAGLRLPFVCVPDPDGRIAASWGQQWRLLRLGRLPAQFVVARDGRVAFAHYARHMADIVPNEGILAIVQGSRAAMRAAAD